MDNDSYDEHHVLRQKTMQYFNCDFTWDMAVEADRLAFRLEQSERKGKGKGKPEPQTFEV